MDTTNTTKALPAAPFDGKVLRELIDRASAGDESVVPALREQLKCPAIQQQFDGNVATLAVETLIRKASATNLFLRETIQRKIEVMRAELSGESPTALEVLLVERIVATWMHLAHIEYLYAENLQMNTPLAVYFQKTLDRAQKRHLSAIKSLATIRRLALPVLQINVARKQVNIVGG